MNVAYEFILKVHPEGLALNYIAQGLSRTRIVFT